jgi:hypothetical protein
MPLSWNDIKSKAHAFSKTWATASNEDSEAKPFLIDFFEVFGITNKRLATFEHAVKKYGGKQGFVDLFWAGVLLVEMKSRGKDLTRAYDQAMGYFDGIKEADLPRYVLVCDFARFALTDLEKNETITFNLEDLHQHVKSFGFIAGYTTQLIQPQDPINVKAAEQMGKLHDQLKAIGYDGHALELYLVRLLFCLFAEDTGIFEKRIFQDYIEAKTKEDGSDLAAQISQIFYILNTPHNKRLKNLDEDLAAFPYVNGKLFEEPLPPASFDRPMRDALLAACALDWSRISPAIFGSLFQSIMDSDARRNLGAHYTSEENILKLIKPLFLDELYAEFEKIANNKAKLTAFHDKLANLTFFDPACGCGNFLVITYRELRKLELEVLKKLYKNDQQILDISAIIAIDVNQFYGIEIEEFPAQIAQVALWLTDHQMNQQISEHFGAYFARIPLKKSANIVNANALQTDWHSVCPNASFIVGNPPFIGKNYRNEQQDADLEKVFTTTHSLSPIRLYKSLDFVSAWHYTATAYLKNHPQTKVAFVSTNSITQGEQVAILWQPLLDAGVSIHFAHRTFSWTNEARGKAAVHCVIIGFALYDTPNKTLFVYDDIKGEPHAVAAKNINPYLLDAPNIVVTARGAPVCPVPEMVNGSKPTDGGNLLLNQTEKDELIAKEPLAEKWIKPFSMGDEFINNIPRYCLWLVDCPPNELRAMPLVLKRVEAVKAMRLASSKAPTREWANRPTLFTEIRQPKEGNYLALPHVSSENRLYIPVGFLPHSHIAGNHLYTIPNATIYHFGIMTSSMHNAWMRATSGRMKSDYQYSAKLTYNNFPWPQIPLSPPLSKGETTVVSVTSESDVQQPPLAKGVAKGGGILIAAQAVLDARAQFPQASLADLYDSRTMPPDLAKAHAKLDKAVDAAYGYKGANNDGERVAFLFDLYQKMTSLLGVEKAKKVSKRVNKGNT